MFAAVRAVRAVQVRKNVTSSQCDLPTADMSVWGGIESY